MADVPAPRHPAYDVARVRACYPVLSDGRAWLDGAAGTQVPDAVLDAIVGAYRAGMGNVNGVFPASHRCEATVDAAREAVADLVGGQAAGVVLGANMTTLTYRFAGMLADGWHPGDEIVVSRLDHDANVRPWVQAATRAGATVRWAQVDVPSGDLPTAQYDDLITERTKLVAVTAASNIIGTIPDVPAIAAKARKVSALTYVDGVHATPHSPIDITALGADFYATSAYKWSGPHVGAVVADPDLLDSLRPDKLAPAPDRVPERFETGTPPFADLAGVTAAVDHLADLVPTSHGSRRQRLLTSMTAVESYEQEQLRHLIGGLAAMPHVRLIGNPARRTATAYFNLAGQAPRDVARQLARRRINVWSGHSYAWEVTDALGVRDTGGGVRAGLVHYNTRADVDRLLTEVAQLHRSD